MSKYDNVNDAVDLFYKRFYTILSSSVFTNVSAMTRFNDENSAQSNIRADVSQSDVPTAIEKLPPKKACDPDKISPYIFKGCTELLARPLQVISDLSLRTKKYLTSWKLSYVVPIYKSGDKSNFKN